MPRDLFGDVTSPSITLGTRKWYSVPLSFLIHAIVIAVLVVVPLMATGVLPMPNDGKEVLFIEPPALPDPPPVRAATPPRMRPVSAEVAPVVEPTTVTPESEFDHEFETTLASDVPVGAGTIDTETIVPPPPVIEERRPEPPRTVRTGGVIQRPERVTYVAPTYPPLAMSARIQGMVIIEATIDTSGRVHDAKILRSDSPILNEAALTAVRQWTYRPTLLNGVPVNVLMTVTVQFRFQ